MHNSGSCARRDRREEESLHRHRPTCRNRGRGARVPRRDPQRAPHGRATTCTPTCCARTVACATPTTASPRKRGHADARGLPACGPDRRRRGCHTVFRWDLAWHGGLVRAYTQATQAGIAAADIVSVSRCIDVLIEVPYSFTSRLNALPANMAPRPSTPILRHRSPSRSVCSTARRSPSRWPSRSSCAAVSDRRERPLRCALRSARASRLFDARRRTKPYVKRGFPCSTRSI